MSCSGWILYTLSDIAEYSKEKISIDKVNTLNYISTENMLQDKKGVVEASSIPRNNSVPAYESGDVLISNIRPYFKKIWFANGNGGASTDVLVIKNKNRDIITDRFLYYTMFQDKFFNYIMSGAKGTKMPRGDKSAIMKYQLTIPDIDEQNKITNIFENLDKKIELNNEMNKILEEMVQALFKRWFVDFEFPNEHGEPYKSSGGEMLESELGMIPKEWSISLLKDFAKFRSGKSIKQEFRDENGSFNIYGSNGIIGKTNEVLMSESCLIIGRVGAYCGSIQLSTLPCWVTDNALIAITNNERYIPFLHMILLKATLREKAGGSAQPLINQSILNSIEFILPEKEILDKYCKIIDNYNKIIVENERENKQLIELRDSLLPKLMSGEIRVEDIEVNL